jgi:integrase
MSRSYIDKRHGSPNWYIYHDYDPKTGQWQRTSTRTTDRKLADQKLAQFILKKPNREQNDQMTLVGAMLLYWEHHGQHLFQTDSIRTTMKRVVEHEPNTRVYDWPIGRQKQFAKLLGPSAGTQRRNMGIIRAAIQWCVDNGDLPTMPTVLKINATDGDGVRPFELPELQRLAEACQSEHERLFFLLCLATAPRPGATLDLTWDRLNAQTGVADYVVPGRRLTKKRRAKAPVCAPALAYLNERRSLGPIVQWNGRPLKGFKMTFRRLAKRAAVNGTAYGIRKAVAIWMRKENVPEWDVKGALGHAVGGETERYAHYRPDYMRAAADSAERLLRAVNPSWMAKYLLANNAPMSANANIFFGAAANDGSM